MDLSDGVNYPIENTPCVSNFIFGISKLLFLKYTPKTFLALVVPATNEFVNTQSMEQQAVLRLKGIREHF